MVARITNPTEKLYCQLSIFVQKWHILRKSHHLTTTGEVIEANWQISITKTKCHWDVSVVFKTIKNGIVTQEAQEKVLVVAKRVAWLTESKLWSKSYSKEIWSAYARFIGGVRLLSGQRASYLIIIRSRRRLRDWPSIIHFASQRCNSQEVGHQRRNKPSWGWESAADWLDKQIQRS